MRLIQYRSLATAKRSQTAEPPGTPSRRNLSSSSVEADSIDGFSNGWVDLSADLSAYAGDVMLGFRYITDGGVSEAGFMVDDLVISGYAPDGAETDAGWTYDGFRATTGTEENTYGHYYIAENSQVAVTTAAAQSDARKGAPRGALPHPTRPMPTCARGGSR